jgi:hypothetical protein
LIVFLPLDKVLRLAASFTQRLLALLDEFLLLVPRAGAALDGIIEFNIATCRLVAKARAHLCASLRREQQRDTRADQRSGNKCRYGS